MLLRRPSSPWSHLSASCARACSMLLEVWEVVERLTRRLRITWSVRQYFLNSTKLPLRSLTIALSRTPPCTVLLRFLVSSVAASSTNWASNTLYHSVELATAFMPSLSWSLFTPPTPQASVYLLVLSSVFVPVCYGLLREPLCCRIPTKDPREDTLPGSGPFSTWVVSLVLWYVLIPFSFNSFLSSPY